MMKRLIPLLLVCCTALFTQCKEPCGPVPSENQLKWQDMEMYAFIH